MKIRIALVLGAALMTMTTAAQAQGLGAEANYARANERWGAELGVGYAFGLGGFSLTPGAGVYLRDGGTALYGRIEAAYQLPASLRLGIGARISDEEARPYATVAMPLLPMVAIKGNVGHKYVSAGVTVGF